MTCILNIAKFCLLLTIATTLAMDEAAAKSVPVTLPSTPPPDTPQGIISFQNKKPINQIPEYQLRHQESSMQNISNKSVTYDTDRERAKIMIQMLQDEELSKAFKKVTETGKKTIEENPGIKAPLFFISGAAGFWAGKTLDLFKQEGFNFTARIEAKNRRSEFTMNSPLLNSKLKFDSNLGNEFIIQRKFETFRTETSLQYRFMNQVISTEIRYKIAPNIDMTFGASKLDQSTRLEYRINF